MENIKKFPEDPHARMNRILRERMAETKESDVYTFKHDGYDVVQNLETGTIIVNGPAGASAHTERPEHTESLQLQDYDRPEMISDPEMLQTQLALVQSVFDSGVLKEKS